MKRFLAYLAARFWHGCAESIRAWWRRHVVADVPKNLDACESCRVVNCDCTKVQRGKCNDEP